MFNVYDRRGMLAGQALTHHAALNWATKLGGTFEWVDLEEEV